MPLDIKEVIKEIEGGLQNSSTARDSARENKDYFELNFAPYRKPYKDGRYETEMPPVESALLKRVAEVLTGFLYKAQPTRKLRDDISSEFLNQVYKSSRAWAKWKHADVLTAIGGYAGFQFAGGNELDSPVKLQQWGRQEIEVWTDPDDPTKPGAVASIDSYDNGSRLRLFTPERIITYERKKGLTGPATGSAAWRKQKETANPYRTLPTMENPKGDGLIPFSFQHWAYPTQEFTQSNPGENLRLLNEAVNNLLQGSTNSLPYLALPLGIAEGIHEGWTPPSKVKPGEWLALPAGDVDAAGNGPRPTLSYLMPELGYIKAYWDHIEALMDHILEMHGVPPSLIRMVQSGARSGLAIQAEQLPVINWVEGRRAQWTDFEEDSARMTMLMAWNRYMEGGYTQEANRIRADLEDWSFALRWPSMYTQLPGPDRNAEDDYRVQNGYASKSDILSERLGITVQEAQEILVKVAKQNEELRALGIDPGVNPGAGQMPGQFGTEQGMSPFNGEGAMQGDAAQQGTDFYQGN